MTGTRFPAGFVWGAATAAFQVEGAPRGRARAVDLGHLRAGRPGGSSAGDTGDVAADHYRRIREDVALMARARAPRLPVLGRLAAGPAGRRRPVNQRGLDFYRRLVDELLGAGVTPWVTLYHWDLPQALEDRGGWTARDTARPVRRVRRHRARPLGDRVPHWTTLNEPWCSAFLGYASGVHAPGRATAPPPSRPRTTSCSPTAWPCAAIRAARPGAAAGHHPQPLRRSTPATRRPGDVDAARRIDGLHNRVFLDPVLPRRIPDRRRSPTSSAFSGLATTSATATWHHLRAARPARRQLLQPAPWWPPGPVAAPPDRTGGPAVAAASARRGRQLRSPRPAGHRHGLGGRPAGPDRTAASGCTASYPRLPLYVTENGAAYPDDVTPTAPVHDPDRLAYLDAHLRRRARAIEAGADVRGYFVWSLLDNFEWAWGYAKRFGIVHVDYATQRAHPQGERPLVLAVIAAMPPDRTVRWAAGRSAWRRCRRASGCRRSRGRPGWPASSAGDGVARGQRLAAGQPECPGRGRPCHRRARLRPNRAARSPGHPAHRLGRAGGPRAGDRFFSEPVLRRRHPRASRRRSPAPTSSSCSGGPDLGAPGPARALPAPAATSTACC